MVLGLFRTLLGVGGPGMGGMGAPGYTGQDSFSGLAQNLELVNGGLRDGFGAESTGLVGLIKKLSGLDLISRGISGIFGGGGYSGFGDVGGMYRLPWGGSAGGYGSFGGGSGQIAPISPYALADARKAWFGVSQVLEALNNDGLGQVTFRPERVSGSRIDGQLFVRGQSGVFVAPYSFDANRMSGEGLNGYVAEARRALYSAQPYSGQGGYGWGPYNGSQVSGTSRMYGPSPFKNPGDAGLQRIGELLDSAEGADPLPFPNLSRQAFAPVTTVSTNMPPDLRGYLQAAGWTPQAPGVPTYGSAAG